MSANSSNVYFSHKQGHSGKRFDFLGSCRANGNAVMIVVMHVIAAVIVKYVMECNAIISYPPLNCFNIAIFLHTIYLYTCHFFKNYIREWYQDKYKKG